MAHIDYAQFRRVWNNRDAVFMPSNGADGTGQDNSTDPIITRDPNDYILPKVSSITLIHALTITIGILGVIILLPMAIKTIKNL